MHSKILRSYKKAITLNWILSHIRM